MIENDAAEIRIEPSRRRRCSCRFRDRQSSSKLLDATISKIAVAETKRFAVSRARILAILCHNNCDNTTGVNPLSETVKLARLDLFCSFF